MGPPPSRAPGPYRPTHLGDWEVIAKIAGGGMSAVYLGRRTHDSADTPSVVALKIVRHDVRMDEGMLQMFLEEGRLIARLVHPNIVRTLEVGGDAEQDFIAMELMLGRTFAAIHDAIAIREVRLNPEIVAWAAARIADALHYAHELTDEHGRPLQLVHRDVNPANVFATFEGEVKLFDFGLAKVTAGEMKGSNIVAGKLSYLSPEQIMQMPIDRRSDIFSLGTTLWELLTGRRLFRRATDIDTVRAVQLGPIPDPRTVAPEIPEELARIAKTALERNREHRYPTAAYLARELDAFVFQRSSPADVTARLATLVDTLFPGERKRQAGWLKPAIAPGRQMGMPNSVPPSPASHPPSHPPGGSPFASRPPGEAPIRSFTPREVTAVMPGAPRSSDSRRAPGIADTAPELPRTPSYSPTPRLGSPVGFTPRDGIPAVSSSGNAWPPPSSQPGPLAETPSSQVPSDRTAAPITERDVANVWERSPPSRGGSSSPPPSPTRADSTPRGMQAFPEVKAPPSRSGWPSSSPRAGTTRPSPSAPPVAQRSFTPPKTPPNIPPTVSPVVTEEELSQTDIQAVFPAPASRTLEQQAPVPPPAPSNHALRRPGGPPTARSRRPPIPLPSKTVPPRKPNTEPPDSDTQVDRSVPPDRRTDRRPK